MNNATRTPYVLVFHGKEYLFVVRARFLQEPLGSRRYAMYTARVVGMPQLYQDLNNLQIPLSTSTGTAQTL